MKELVHLQKRGWLSSPGRWLGSVEMFPGVNRSLSALRSVKEKKKMHMVCIVHFLPVNLMGGTRHVLMRVHPCI